MRLAFLTSGSPHPDGEGLIYRWIRIRAKAYRDRKHEVAVFSQPKKILPDEYSLDGLPYTLLSPRKAAQALRIFSPDAVLIHHVSPWTTKVADAVSFPKIFWIYGPDVAPPSDYYYEPGRFTRFFLGMLDRREKRRFARHLSTGRRFVCSSGYAMEKLLELLPQAASSADVLYAPVDASFAHREFSSPLKGLALEPLEHRTLLASGVDLMIRAYAGISKTTLTLAGNGNAVYDLTRWIGERKSAIELKAMNITAGALSELLAGHDYLVIASRHERQLLAASEAMARGLPVIAPRAWAFPEAVIDGETGATFEVESVDELRGAIGAVLAGHAGLSAGARGWVKSNCALDSVIERELALIAAGVNA